MSDVLVILGMHRSGTSAVAGVLTKLGGKAPEHPMAPSPDNPRGYFESDSFMHLHDELLSSAGSSWQDWRKFNPAWYRSPAIHAFKQRAKEIFEAEFGKVPLPVLKDPRICRFVPFWGDVLKEIEATPRFVIPIRSPLDVAHSLGKREPMSLTKGLLLWLRHVLDAEVETRNAARSIFTWNEFLSDWRGISEKISFDTGLSWPRLSDRSAFEVEQFMSSELVHNTSEHTDLITHSDVNEWTIRAYEALLELVRNPFSNSASDRLDEIRALFEQSCAVFGRVLVDYEVGLEDLQARANRYQSESDHLLVQHGELRAELAAVFDEKAGLLAQLQSRKDEITETAALLADRTARLERDEARLAQAVREKGELSNELAAHVAKLAASVEERSRLFSQLQALEQALVEATTLRTDLNSRLEQVEIALRVAMSAKENLAADLAQTRSWLSEEERKNAESGETLVRIKEDKEDAVRTLAACRQELEETSREKNRLTAELDLNLSEFQRMERASAERAAMMEADLATAQDKTKSSCESQINDLRRQLVDAEAGFAKSKAARGNRGIWAKFLPPAGRSYILERRLIRLGLFDTDWYKSQYPEAAGSGLSAVRHYLEEGYCRGYRPNPFFDTRWYLEQYEDVRHSGMNPLLHYATQGYREGRDPGPDFQTNFYLLAYPDVRASKINPLAHYLRYGQAEGRMPVRPPGIVGKTESQIG